MVRIYRVKREDTHPNFLEKLEAAKKRNIKKKTGRERSQSAPIGTEASQRRQQSERQTDNDTVATKLFIESA